MKTNYYYLLLLFFFFLNIYFFSFFYLHKKTCAIIFFRIHTIKIPIFTEIYVADRFYNRSKKMHAHNKKALHTMGGWWTVDENCPYVKYLHYYLDRKIKCSHTPKYTTLIRDGGGRVMKMVSMSNIATTTVIEKTKCTHTHTHLVRRHRQKYHQNISLFEENYETWHMGRIPH